MSKNNAVFHELALLQGTYYPVGANAYVDNHEVWSKPFDDDLFGSPNEDAPLVVPVWGIDFQAYEGSFLACEIDAIGVLDILGPMEQIVAILEANYSPEQRNVQIVTLWKGWTNYNEWDMEWDGGCELIGDVTIKDVSDIITSKKVSGKEVNCDVAKPLTTLQSKLDQAIAEESRMMYNKIPDYVPPPPLPDGCHNCKSVYDCSSQDGWEGYCNNEGNMPEDGTDEWYEWYKGRCVSKTGKCSAWVKVNGRHKNE